MSQGRNMKKMRKTSIIAIAHPPLLVRMKGKKMMAHSPDRMDRTEAMNIRMNPKKMRTVPAVSRPMRLPKGLPERCSLLAH